MDIAKLVEITHQRLIVCLFFGIGAQESNISFNHECLLLMLQTLLFHVKAFNVPSGSAKWQNQTCAALRLFETT